MAKTSKTKTSQKNSQKEVQAQYQTQQNLLADFQDGNLSLGVLEILLIKKIVGNFDDVRKEIARKLYNMGCSSDQSATMFLANQDFKRTKDFRTIIDPIRFERRALKTLSQALITKILPLALVLLLQACVPLGLYNNAYKASVEYFNPAPFALTPQIKNLPYAMQLVEHRGKKAVMVLAHASQQKLTWVDSESNEFTTFHGKIINSQGLTNDFESLQPPNLHEIFKFLAQRIHSSVERESLVRFLKPTTTFLQTKHTFSLSPKASKLFERKIDGKLLEYYILRESVEIPAVRWQYSNTYWLDTSGRVLKSKQFITPDQPKYYLETLKNFAG